MIELTKYIYTKPGSIVLSCLLGFGLASIFREICDKKSCMIYVGPSKDEIDKIYKWNNNCYKLKENPIKCPSSSSNTKKIIPFNSQNGI